jgi:hypothetical protein
LVGVLAGAALPVSLVAVLVGRGSVEHFVFTVVPALLGVPLLQPTVSLAGRVFCYHNHLRNGIKVPAYTPQPGELPA